MKWGGYCLCAPDSFYSPQHLLLVLTTEHLHIVLTTDHIYSLYSPLSNMLGYTEPRAHWIAVFSSSQNADINNPAKINQTIIMSAFTEFSSVFFYLDLMIIHYGAHVNKPQPQNSFKSICLTLLLVLQTTTYQNTYSSGFHHIKLSHQLLFIIIIILISFYKS